MLYVRGRDGILTVPVSKICCLTENPNLRSFYSDCAKEHIGSNDMNTIYLFHQLGYINSGHAGFEHMDVFERKKTYSLRLKYVNKFIILVNNLFAPEYFCISLSESSCSCNSYT